MSEKVKIILKDDQPKKKEVTIGTKTVRAERGKPTEVELGDLNMWLKTGKFDRYEKPSEPADDSDLPADIPARAILVREKKTFEQVRAMTRDDLIGIKGIAETSADHILEYLNGGNQENE